MHKYPHRSWGKTYNQLWNLAMNEMIPRAEQHSGSQGRQASGSGKNKYGDWRDNCCWKYNKGKCKKWNCDFDHRCNYCGGWSHAAINCYKKKGNNKKDKKETSPAKKRD